MDDTRRPASAGMSSAAMRHCIARELLELASLFERASTSRKGLCVGVFESAKGLDPGVVLARSVRFWDFSCALKNGLVTRRLMPLLTEAASAKGLRESPASDISEPYTSIWPTSALSQRCDPDTVAGGVNLAIVIVGDMVPDRHERMERNESPPTVSPSHEMVGTPSAWVRPINRCTGGGLVTTT